MLRVTRLPSMKRWQTPPEVRVRVHQDGAPDVERRFTAPFEVGRAEACDVPVSSGLASRCHLEVVFEEGAWWARDLGSTNGTYRDGEKIHRTRLTGRTRLQIGEDGPVLQLAVAPARLDAPGRAGRGEATAVPAATPQAGGEPSESGGPSEPGMPSGASVTRYVQRYFQEGDDRHDDDRAPAGQHTQMIRQAYARVRQQQRRRYYWIIGIVLVLCVGTGIFAAGQYWENQRLRTRAQDIFYELKAQDLAISNLKRHAEEAGDASLEEQLAVLEERRHVMAQQYEGYVRELGLRRELSEKERIIYQTARIFNESEMEMPAGFIRRVREEINNYWLTPAGKRRFTAAVEKAEAQGYTPVIVQTMQDYGLPPEFFYLALQESNFQPEAVGPRTRWGIAKGMWQFIPSTARRYGLSTGPRVKTRVVDPLDERHDFEKSTEAAARYLHTIYRTLAQASGLLVMASYNWGEHRVAGKLERLPGPQAIPAEAFEGVPQDPEERNYWRFLTEYEERMPEQTKDYVIKIFAAAVIGQNPRLFGIDMDNPLRKYMQAPLQAPSQSVSFSQESVAS